MEPYATLNDMMLLFRDLNPPEAAKAEAYLPIVSDELRQKAHQYNRDLDAMIAADPSLATVAKRVTVDIVARIIRESASPEAGTMTQISQSALGYSVSGTFANPGGGLFIKNAELDALGLRRQRVGGMEIYGNQGHHN